MRWQRKHHQLRYDWLGVMLLGDPVQRRWFDRLMSGVLFGERWQPPQTLSHPDGHSQPTTDWGMRPAQTRPISHMFKMADLPGLSCLSAAVAGKPDGENRTKDGEADYLSRWYGWKAGFDPGPPQYGYCSIRSAANELAVSIMSRYQTP